MLPTLSCLEMSDNQEILNISELYGYNDEDRPDSAYPIYYNDIAKAQKTDAKLKQKLVSQKEYTLDTFCGGNQNYVLMCQITKYAYLQHYRRKLEIGIMRCSVIQEKLEQIKTSVNILTGKAFVQQSTTCVRNAQHAKEQKQLIRNMANCHLNRLKKIPGTRYV